ncbi:MAG: CPBP family intramembrane metalloprotease, partial [Rhodospirillaceae bacterium]|nr:CPBP family intramembrane metalloprotease [Rhodospirillaceae bacterium]
MFGPACAGAILTKWRGGDQWRKCLGLSFRVNPWWVVAWLTPAIVTALVIAVSTWLPDISLVSFADGVAARRGGALTAEQMAQIKPLWIIVLIALGAGIIPNALAAAGEELGWRGYLWSEMRDKGFWRASMTIGIVWGFWHAPIILMGYNYPTA